MENTPQQYPHNDFLFKKKIPCNYFHKINSLPLINTEVK